MDEAYHLTGKLGDSFDLVLLEIKTAFSMSSSTEMGARR